VSSLRNNIREKIDESLGWSLIVLISTGILKSPSMDLASSSAAEQVGAIQRGIACKIS
jgi:hypothetical protein